MRSACSAPADLIAWRIAMIPDGLTPNRFKPVTSERRLEPLTTATCPPASLTSIRVFGVVTVLSDHDCAGPRVDDNARRRVGLDHQLADLGHHPGDAEVARTKQLHRSPVALKSEVPVILATGIGVDRVDDPHRCGVVRIPEVENHLQ